MEHQMCGTCKFHKTDPETSDWVCTNSDSEYFAEFTPYEHSCYEWEDR